MTPTRNATAQSSPVPQPLPFLMMGALLGLISGWIALAI